MRLNVNGNDYEIDADPQMPLLWALRDLMNIKGPKFGCGVAACGACTVLMDGLPVRSCSYPVSEASGRITTIEGIAQGANLHRVQKAWIEHNVPQCGYCQSGQILAAVALLDEVPQPTDADIDTAMTNLCRCGTYPRIKAAIKTAAGMES